MTGARRVSRREVELGDIITHVNDREVRSRDDYLTALEKHEPGDTVTIHTRREDEEKRYRIELIESQ